MKKILYITLIGYLFCFTSCTSTTEEVTYDGKIKIVKEYNKKGNKDKQLSKETAYYLNGTIKYEGSYKNNQKSGAWIYYFNNGNVWASTSFVDDKEHGIKTTYFPNGNIRFKGKMKNGKRNGIWKFYEENGKLALEKEF